METDHNSSIIRYYDNTKLDYKWLWFRDGNRSVHFGYHDEGAISHGDALVNLNKVMAMKADVREGDVVLDAGCGQGGGAIWLAENFMVDVKGITLVPHQVAIAKKEAAKKNLSARVSFYERDYIRTCFPDESFSLVWACESMCHAENKSDFYKEAYRILKPGGRIVCADYIRTKRPLSREHETLLHQWLGGWSIKDLDTAEEHRKYAETNGFSGFELDDISVFTRPSLQHLHSMASKLWKLGKTLKRLGLRNHVNHGNHFASIKQFEALENKLWFYGLLTVRKE